ncbi:hypothetical protein SCO02_18470 [Staphylococcus ureilyticus]|uniref:Uncharacterized protein n=1 Tax=Staphylococcus ureilyticus TaxID=94138 RepID=A0AB34AJ85_STAUR|nr:hypothetical protein SCO02_18470 [Staphylococcus ureilyticus]
MLKNFFTFPSFDPFIFKCYFKINNNNEDRGYNYEYELQYFIKATHFAKWYCLKQPFCFISNDN